MKYFFCTFVCLSLLSRFVCAQQTLLLSEADLTKANVTFGQVVTGCTAAGQPALVRQTLYKDVIGVHAPATIRFDLHKQAFRFRAKVAIADAAPAQPGEFTVSVPLADGTKLRYRMGADDTKTFVGVEGTGGTIEPGSAEFVLTGDGEELYHSRVVRAGDIPVDVDVPLKGIRYLTLRVTSAGDGVSGDNALWIEPQIEYDGTAPETTVAGTDAERGPVLSEKAQADLSAKIAALPVQEDGLYAVPTVYDWLLSPVQSQAKVCATPDRKGIVISNGMVARVFRVVPNLATTDIVNRMTGESMIRAVSSEGSLTIDGKKFHIGGLGGQPERGYLLSEWLDGMYTLPNSFIVEDFVIEPLTEHIRWARKRWALNKQAATGKVISFTLRGPGELHNIVLKVSYAIYDHIPTICKHFELVNQLPIAVNVDAFEVERLAFAEPESPGGGDPSRFRLPNIHVESDYACGGEFFEQQTDITERWIEDPQYTSQRNYLLQTPCVLQVAPPIGPDKTVNPGGTFRSFRVYEMPFDSDDRERKGLFRRRFYRTVAPWTTENPIFMHLTSSNPDVIRQAVNQCDSTGYEMVIISFGSGLNAEDISDANIAKWKSLVDYAASKNIEMGCYSLLASRWISDSVDVINPETGKRGGMRFGSSPCLSSKWGEDYFRNIRTFIEKTGMRCFEHDGSYPGDVCASTTHAHHKGLNDSQWNQFYTLTDLYHWMCESGIYINVPDFYFLNGSTKTGIGYRETNWSLPRDRQIIHARQLNYDCTWDRMASSCWSFVPLVQYHGGGAEATLEPLSQHLYEYRTHMVQNYGAGVQACYRGPRLYDTPETKAVVVEVIDWYKKYRNILNSDIIHLRRPDARDWDGLMHVSPEGKERGLALFFNPTDREIVRTIRLPLYYTGLTKSASIREAEGKSGRYRLNRDYSVDLKVTIPARGYTWYVVEK